MAILSNPQNLAAPYGWHWTTRKWNYLAAAVLVLSVLPFALVLGGEMVWDDYMLTDGSAIGGGKSLLKCFTEPFLWHFFRPLVSVSFFFERMFWRGEPLGYHITNLLLHLGGTAVMMRLLQEAFRSRWTAILGSIFFAIHPVQVGAVAWIGGRTDSLASLWILLYLLMLVRAARAPVATTGPWLAYAVFFFNLAIYTKEQCLPLLLLAPLAYRVWKPDSGVRLPRTGLFALLPFVISAGLFLYAGYHLGMPRPSALPYSPAAIAEMAGETVTYYTLLLFAPTPSWMHRLSLEGFADAGIWPAAFGFFVVGLFVGALFWCRRRHPAAAWFLVLTALAILPVTNVLPLPFLVVAPYRAAIGWIGLAAVLGRLFGRAMEHLDGSGSVDRAPAAALSLALCILFLWHGALAAWGSFQWRSEARIFSQFVSHDPENIVAKSVFTFSLERDKRYREAAEIQEAALTLAFGSDAWRELHTAERAIREDPMVSWRARRNQGTREDPRIWIAGFYAQLANCRNLAGEHDVAQQWLDIGDRIWSNHARIHLGKGHYAVRAGDWREAARRFRWALAIEPGNGFTHAELGVVYAKLEQWTDAEASLRKSLALRPGNQKAEKALADVLKRRPPDSIR